MSKTYAFILGRTPSLSVAELMRAVPAITIEGLIDGVCIARADELPEGFLNLLGGTIKLAEVVATFPSIELLNAEVLRTYVPPREGRVIFGLSLYGAVSQPERRQLYLEGLALKKLLRDEGRRSRYVVSLERQLSSVVVAKNKLISEGAEFIVIRVQGMGYGGEEVILARTVAVQEFESYGERDFDRPGRSAVRGMLPPKLSQMMLNIAHGDKNLPLLDPFCGSGTVLGEALLMGYTRVVGSDIDPRAVEDSIAYLTWLTKQHPEFAGRWQVILTDARELPKHLADGSIGAIVAEPYLGPPQKGNESLEQLKRLMAETLTPLYSRTIEVLATLLAPSGHAVIAFPVFGAGANAVRVSLPIITNHLAIEALVPDEATIRYERPGQRVAREIVCLKKVV